MKVFRSTCWHQGRALLVSTLIGLVLVKSTEGQALVLHQHSDRWAHLHLLGFGDRVSAAAWSSRFGHGWFPYALAGSSSQPVRVLAIVQIGSIFVSTDRASCIDAACLDPFQGYPTDFVARQEVAPTMDGLSFPTAAFLGRTTSAVILMRNHALLI